MTTLVFAAQHSMLVVRGGRPWSVDVHLQGRPPIQCARYRDPRLGLLQHLWVLGPADAGTEVRFEARERGMANRLPCLRAMGQAGSLVPNRTPNPSGSTMVKSRSP